VHEVAQLIRLVVQVEVILIFIRILISWFPGVPPWHPLVRMLSALVDPVLVPFRRLLPTLGGLDFSPIVAIVVLQLVGGFVVDLIEPAPGTSLTFSLAVAFRDLVHTILLFITIIVLLRVVVSFLKVSPFHPAVQLLRSISSPLVRPFGAMAAAKPAADVPAIVALAVYIVAIVVADWLLGDLVRSVRPSV
jgi:YggT family protein